MATSPTKKTKTPRFSLHVVHPIKTKAGNFGTITAHEGKTEVLHITLSYGPKGKVYGHVDLDTGTGALATVSAGLKGTELEVTVLEVFSPDVPWGAKEYTAPLAMTLQTFLGKPVKEAPDVTFTDEKYAPAENPKPRGSGGRTLPRPELQPGERVNRLTLFKPKVPTGLVAIVEVFEGAKTLLTETVYLALEGGLKWELDVEPYPSPDNVNDPVVQAEVEAALRDERELRVLVQEPRGKRQYEADLSDALDGWLNELFR